MLSNENGENCVPSSYPLIYGTTEAVRSTGTHTVASSSNSSTHKRFLAVDQEDLQLLGSSVGSKRQRGEASTFLEGGQEENNNLEEVHSDVSAFEGHPYELYKATFIVLSRYETLSILNLDILRHDIEDYMMLPPKGLNVSDKILADMVSDYRFTLQQKEKRQVTQGILKYTKRETDMIIGVCRSFIRENNLTLEDICPGLRSDSDHLKGAKKDLVRKLFDDLHVLLPYRQRDTVKFFVERKLFLSVHALKGRWTDEEKNQLLNLYDQHGPKWAKIGRELNKRHEDVRMMYRQLASIKRGRYSPEEETRLVAAIRETMGKFDCPINEIPTLGIAWTNVARLMGNERVSVEYQIKWGHLRNRLLYGKNNNHTEAQQLETDRILLDSLALQCADDTSEVNWQEVSRRCNVAIQHVDFRWKNIRKKFPQANPGQSFTEYVRQLLYIHSTAIPHQDYRPIVEFDIPYSLRIR